MSLLPQKVHETIFASLAPSMRYQAGEDVCAWQKRARAALEALLGLPLPSCKPEFCMESEGDYNESTREIRFHFFSEPGVTVCGHLLLPKGKENLPLIICLQGHSRGMHISLARPRYEGDEESISGGDRDFARQIAKRGQAALVLEQRCFGERGGKPEPDCYQASMQALMLGRTMIGERCWDVSRAIDVILENFSQINPSRIALMGNSGGGTISLYAPALDERISAVMPSCAFSGFWPSIGAQHHCSCNYVPGMARAFDMGDLAALIAPRPLVIVSGEKDEIFPVDSAKEQFELTQAVYRAMNAQSVLCHVIGKEGHRFYAEEGWRAFDEVTGWK